MAESKLPDVLFIMGPTASGKTDLAMRIFDRIPSRIISVDSAMIYKTMDIGTAKPDETELIQYPHALIDIRDPTEVYSAADFVSDAEREIDQVLAEGRLPILVGGTILYFKALAQGLASLPKADSALRSQIEDDARRLGWPAMHARLSSLDPLSGKRLQLNDSQRIQRALEVYLLTGRSIEAFWAEQKSLIPKWNIVPIALMPSDRSLLHKKIGLRFEQMINAGLQTEVEQLMRRGDLHLDLPSMRSVGYRQMWHYLQGDWTEPLMRDKTLVATRQLAKRQMTWLRGWAGALSIEPFGKSQKLIDETLRQINDSSI